jgi:preprotein translocase subunit SecY
MIHIIYWVKQKTLEASSVRVNPRRLAKEIIFCRELLFIVFNRTKTLPLMKYIDCSLNKCIINNECSFPNFPEPMHSQKSALKESVIVVLVLAATLILAYSFVWSQVPNFNERAAKSVHKKYVEKPDNSHP